MMPTIKTNESYVINVKIPRLTARTKRKLLFKMLSLVLIVIGIIACCLFPEDATGGFMCCLLGIATLFGKPEDM